MCNIQTFQVFAFIAALIVSSCQQSEPTQTSSQQTALPVHIEKVSLSRQTGGLVYSGDIRPLRVSNANFTIPGKVIFLPHETGDFVRKGQSMGLLDSTDYHIELKRTQAQLMEAEDVYKRFKQLYEKESLPEKDYISAQSAYKQAKAGLEMIQKRIADTRLNAPSTGLIMEKNAEVGSSVSNDMAVYRIATLDPAYAEISVPEVEIGKIKVGQAATVVIPTLNHKEFTGTVKIIPPVANPQTRTFPVKILLQNPNYLIKGGMIAEVTLSVADTMQTRH